MLNDLKQQARAAEVDWRAAQAAITKDGNLSAQGKADAFAKAEARYRERIAELQRKADTFIGLELERINLKRNKAAEAAFASQLETLGPAVAADVLRRRLETLTGSQIADAYAKAAHPFERAALAQYGSIEIERRIAAGDDDPGLFGAFRDITAAAQDEELTKLTDEQRALERFNLADLDVATVRRDTAAALGVSADALQLET